MTQCAAGHRPYEGPTCWPCYKQRRRAAGHDVAARRARARGEPEALVVDDDWREDAACRFPPHGLDADDWFAHQQTLAERERHRLAIAVCRICPVQAACLAYAVTTRQPWGVWGGETADEQRTAKRQQRAV